MAKIAVIKTGEQYFANCIASNKHIKLDKFIFANVPYVTGSTEVNVNGTLPTASQIKHTTSVTQSGLISDNAVVYSVVLDSTIGDFEFNYVGLMNSETNTLCMVLHTDIQQKLQSQGQQQGNTLTESLWLEIDGAAQATGIMVNAETWMIDYSARMAGEDERIRLSNLDHYGRLAVHSGFNITYNTDYTINPGVAYVAGLRVQHIAAKSLVAQKGESIYIDAWLSGTVTGAWSVNYKIIVGVDLTDYKDGIFQHYVEKIATISEPGIIQKPDIYSVVNSVNGESGTVTVTPAKINAVSKDGDVMTGGLTAPEITAMKYGHLYRLTVNNNNTFSHYLTGSDGLNATRLRWFTETNTWNFENSKVQISGRNVLSERNGVNRRPTSATGLTICYAKIATGKWTVNGQGNVSFLISGINGYGENLSQGLSARNQLDYVSFSVRSSKLEGAIIHHIIEDSYNITSSRVIYGWVANKVNNTIELWVKSNAYAGCGSITLMSELPPNMILEDSINWVITEPVGIIYGEPKITLNTQNFNEHITSYPIGSPIAWPSLVMPQDGRTYLKCNGATFDKTRYPKLALAYQTGQLPDLRGEFIRGYDDGRGIDSGRTLLSNQEEKIKSHNHFMFSNETGTGSYSSNLTPTSYVKKQANSGNDEKYAMLAGANVAELGLTSSTGETETVPRNIAFMYIVKAE